MKGCAIDEETFDCVSVRNAEIAHARPSDVPPAVTAPSFASKRLLTPLKGTESDFFYSTCTLNLYHGCNHGCVYCDSRSVCYHLEDFSRVRVKQDCLAQLERELRGKREAGVIGMGAASDPYNALELELCVTRGALELCRRYGFGVCLSTKGTLITRDADVLSALPSTCVSFSITTAEDALARQIEPHAPTSTERFAAMRTLADAGVYTGVWINPMLPFLTDSPENLRRLLRLTAEAGGRFAVCFFGVTLREGDREYFYAALDANPRFAGVKQRYIDAFGLRYICPTPDAEALWPLFTAECERLGLRYRFDDINREALARRPRQTSLLEGVLPE